MSDDREETVRRRAYELWQQEGGDHGRDQDHWHRANSEIGADDRTDDAAVDAAIDAGEGASIVDAEVAPTTPAPTKPAARPRKPKTTK